jgi:hypothetical protein
LLFNLSVIAQPYLYFTKTSLDTSNGEEQYLSLSMRYNINTKQVEKYPQFGNHYDQIITDPSQQLISVSRYYHNNPENYLIMVQDSSYFMELNNNIKSVEQLFYLPVFDKIIIFSNDYKLLSVVQISTKEIISELIEGSGGSSILNPQRVAFISKDSSMIYFYAVDTLTRNEQVWTYSIIQNQIIAKNNLSVWGKTDSDGYIIDYGKNDVGIINSYSSYNNPNRDFYFTIHDFATNYSSGQIYHNGLCQSYFTMEGKYLVLMNIAKDSSNLVYHTGAVEIYNTLNGQLLKSLTLLESGIIYTSDLYPDNLYYAVNLENDPEIYILNIDSILKAEQKNYNIKLLSSTGTLLTSGSLQYYEGGWKDAVNNGDGTFLVDTTLSPVNLKMTYEYCTQTLSGISLLNRNVAVFRTISTIISVHDSSGNVLDGGTAEYNADGWREFGTTINGEEVKELLPGSYTFRVIYNGVQKEMTQDISVSSIVEFIFP